MKHAPILHRLEYAAFLLARAPLTVLPHAAARRLGAAFGDLAWYADRRHRRVALDNLALAFPERPAAARWRLARACFRHFGLALADALSASRFDLVELCRRVTLVDWQHLQEARRLVPGHGVVVITAHLGLWEVAAHSLGAWGGPLWAVGRPLDNPYLDRHLEGERRRFGNRLLAKRGAARGLLRALAAGENAALMIDQRVRAVEGGIEVPFFGRPALTTPLVARLSRRLGVPVVPGFGFPAPGGRYRVVFRPPILPGDEAAVDEETAVRELTARHLAALEAEIRRRPEQWLWMHRRWRR